MTFGNRKCVRLVGRKSHTGWPDAKSGNPGSVTRSWIMDQIKSGSLQVEGLITLTRSGRFCFRMRDALSECWRVLQIGRFWCVGCRRPLRRNRQHDHSLRPLRLLHEQCAYHSLSPGPCTLLSTPGSPAMGLCGRRWRQPPTTSECRANPYAL